MFASIETALWNILPILRRKFRDKIRGYCETLLYQRSLAVVLKYPFLNNPIINK